MSAASRQRQYQRLLFRVFRGHDNLQDFRLWQGEQLAKWRGSVAFIEAEKMRLVNPFPSQDGDNWIDMVYPEPPLDSPE